MAMQTIKKNWKRFMATGLVVAMTFAEISFAGSNVAKASDSNAPVVMTDETASFAGSAQSVGVGTVAHTQDEIRAYIEASGATMKDPVVYTVTPSSKAPYSLGELSEATMNNGIAMINQIRYIAGLPEVTLGTEYTEMEQAAALVNAANNVLSHYPTQPADMSDELYNLGAQGASRSNIGMGYNNLNHAIMTGWMADEDSTNIERVGHRRWILNPTMGKTSFGVVGRYYAMYSFDHSRSSSITGVAWPAREMPVEYFDKTYPWTYSLGSTITNTSAVTVVLTRQSDGTKWRFSEAGADGDFYINNGGYGQTGCIIFRPNNFSYASGDTYEVEITGLSRTVKYYVNFFKAVPEPKPIDLPVNTDVSSVLGSGESVVFTFTAPYKGTNTYTFYTKSSIDTMGILYSDEDCKQTLASDDDSGLDRNFKIVYNLAYGQTVYLKVLGYSLANGPFIVRADADVPAEEQQYTLSGTVRYSGELPSKTTIRLYKAGDLNPSYEKTVTGSSFSIGGVVSGTYTLKVSADGYTETSQQVSVNKEGISANITLMADIKYLHTIALQNNLALIYYIAETGISNMTNVRLEILKEQYDKSGTRTLVETTIPGVFGNYGESYNEFKFVYTGVSSYQVGDNVQATLCADFNGVTYRFAPDNYSVADYCYNNIKKTTVSDTTKRLLVDLLNYASASQTYFGIRTNALVNRNLTTAQKAYATQGTPELNSVASSPQMMNAKAKFTGKTLVLGNNVDLKIYMQLPENAAQMDISLRVSYQQISGKTKLVYIPFSDFVYDDVSDEYSVRFAGLIAPEFRKELKLTIMDGLFAISATHTYSVETYAYNRINSTSSKQAMKNLVIEMMKYSDSAYAVLNKEGK